MALVLTIDLGTTNLKVGVVNERGEILSVQSARTPSFKNQQGIVMHDPDGIRTSILSLAKKALSEVSIQDVRFVISSAYQFGLLMLDKNEQPLSGMTLLTDIRPQRTFSEFVERVDAEDLYRRTGCPLISQYVLPRLYYFHKKEPEFFSKVTSFQDGKSFLYQWLTGENITDMSTAAATQIFNLRNYHWDAELLSTLNLSPDQFPVGEDGLSTLAGLREEIRSELGLEKSVKVVLGVFDGAALGAGLTDFEPGVGIVNLGTTAMLRVPGTEPAFDGKPNKRIQAYPLRKGFFLNGGALNNAALPLDWMKENLFEIDIKAKELAEISKKPPLISLPYLTGERDTEVGPFASGVFFGVRKRHQPVDFARSVLEGVAFSMRYIYEAISENNMEIDKISMGGGGAKIDAWPQIFADVLNKPITLSEAPQPALVGSALLALVAGGVYSSNEEARKMMLKQGDHIEPVGEHVKIREEQYQFYKELRETVGPLYKKHARLNFE